MWVGIVVSVVLSIVSYALQPRPHHETPSAGKFDLPRIDPSANIPVVFGTVLIKDPSIVWYGDLDTSPIKTEGGKK